MYPSSWLCVRPTVLRRLSLLTALELISHLKLSNIFVYVVHSQFSPLFSPLSEICVSQLRCADCLYTVYREHTPTLAASKQTETSTLGYHCPSVKYICRNIKRAKNCQIHLTLNLYFKFDQRKLTI